jgi:NADPH-dependent F420 reductase
MRIAILGGTGKLGLGLIARLNLTDHEAVVGTRDVSRAPAAVKAMSYADASSWCETAIITVPYTAHRAVLEPLRGALEGKIVIDATVPINPQNFFRPASESGNSAAEETAALLGNASVYAGFQTISHRILRQTDRAEDVLVAGGSSRKANVMELIRNLNLRPIDAGPLEAAHLLECMTLLLLSVNKFNHVKESGLKVTGI